MIRITFDLIENQIKSFQVTGHAGYAEKGQDIICAGVSAISQTALAGLLHHLENKPIYKMENGFLECNLPADLENEDSSKAQLILSTMKIGILMMEEAYKGHMHVTVRRQ